MEEKLSEISDAAITAAEETIITQTSGFIHWCKSLLSWENLFKIIGAVLLLFLMWIVYRIVLRGVKKVPLEKTNQHKQMIAVKFVKYVFYASVVIYILGLFGVKLSAVWGAAGIAGVAIGFAAQTSVSNVISGLFVLTEGALKVGDTIIVNGITGVVDTISLLSVKVHTFDNQMVRIPNSSIINSNLTNNSYHDKRRITLGVSISYDADMRSALEALSKAPELCPTVLQEPAPAVWFDGFGDSGIDMTVAAWFKPENFLQTKNDLFIAIKKVLDDAKIEIPFNQLDVKVK